MKHRFHRTSTSQKQRTLRTGFQISVLLALVSASTSKATVYTYQGASMSTTTPTSDNFSGTDFTPTLGTAGGTPVSTTADTIGFGGNATYTATDDFGATINANELTFGNVSSGTAVNITLARGTSTATGANSITLGGTTPSIVLNNTAGTNGLVVDNLDLILAANTTITGAGSLTIGGTITATGAYGLSKGGGGVLTLNGAVSYTGNTTLGTATGGGNIVAGANNVLSSSSVVVLGNTSSGQLQIGSTTQTVANIQANTASGSVYIAGTNSGVSTLIVGGNNASTSFNDTLGGLTLVKNGTGTLNLGGATNNINSALTVNAGTLVLNKTGTGNYADYYGISVTGGSLQLGSSSNGNQILDTAQVAMSGGTFDLNGQTETIGGLSSTGGGTVTNTSTSKVGTLTVGGSTTAETFAGTITDGTTETTALAKIGTGTQTLSGTNTYSGGTTISAGTLELNTFASLPNSGTGTTVASGATLAVAVGGTSTITSANVATLAANASFTSGGFLGLDTTGGNFTESGTLTGALALNKLGANVLTLTGANTYTGGTTLSAGTLVASGAVGALPASSAVTMAPNTTLSIQNDASGTIAQGNAITIPSQGGATATTTIDVRNNGGATTGSVVALGALNNGTAANALINAINFTGANGYTLSFTTLALAGLGGQSTYLNPTTTSVSIGSVTNQITGTASGSFDTLFLNGTSTGNAITGVIADSSVHTTGTGNNNGATAVTLNATNTGLGMTSVWTFTGANTYSGVTTLSNGGALILNTPSTSTSAGTVAVNSGGTLLGNGYAPSGLLTVASGGNLAPGATAASTPTTAASAGVLHVGALTLNTTSGAGSNFNVFLSDNGSTTGAGAGTSYSQLDANGTVAVAGKLNLTISGSLALNDKFFILLNSGTNTTSGTFSNITGTSFTSGGDTFTINYADNGDGGTVADDISLTVTGVIAVPEPSTYVGGLLTLAAGAWTLRRRIIRMSA